LLLHPGAVPKGKRPDTHPTVASVEEPTGADAPATAIFENSAGTDWSYDNVRQQFACLNGRSRFIVVGASGWEQAAPMAKLRVGDIEIDGSNVRIGGELLTGGESIVRQTPGTPTPRPTNVPNPVLPIASPFLIGGGIALMIGGVALYVLSGSWSLSAFLFRGGLLASFGAGVTTLGVLKQIGLRQRRAAEARSGRERLQHDIETIARSLSAAHMSNTLERIGQRTGLAPRRVVEVLAAMREVGRIKEDLNVDTGEWYYTLPPPEPKNLEGDISKSLDEHLRDMKEEER
jgi:hypothetical protein